MPQSAMLNEHTTPRFTVSIITFARVTFDTQRFDNIKRIHEFLRTGRIKKLCQRSIQLFKTLQERWVCRQQTQDVPHPST